MRALLLEDDTVLSKEIVSFLEKKEIYCEAVFDGKAFLEAHQADSFDIFLLDIHVPRLSGMDVCREIRKKDKSTPILMLTAYGEIDNKVRAFDLGVDDYLVKPFHFDELHLRIRSLFRRSNKENTDNQENILSIDDLSINISEMAITRNGQQIDLTPKEYKLLLLLAKAKGRTLSKQSIAEQLWDINFDPNLNTIEVYINFLRKKIDKGHERKLIHTRPGFGYYLKPEDKV